MRPALERSAAARVIARLVARDDRLDWREIEFLDRSGAFALLGVSRDEFMRHLAESLGAHHGRRAAGTAERVLRADIEAVRERPLQLVAAALLVYLSEIDRAVKPQESELVARALRAWRIDPETLERELRVPGARTRAVLPESAQRLGKRPGRPPYPAPSSAAAFSPARRPSPSAVSRPLPEA
jgi:hypothetical protein